MTWSFRDLLPRAMERSGTDLGLIERIVRLHIGEVTRPDQIPVNPKLRNYMSRPMCCPFYLRPVGWYLIDFARGRPTNPARNSSQRKRRLVLLVQPERIEPD